MLLTKSAIAANFEFKKTRMSDQLTRIIITILKSQVIFTRFCWVKFGEYFLMVYNTVIEVAKWSLSL